MVVQLNTIQTAESVKQLKLEEGEVVLDALYKLMAKHGVKLPQPLYIADIGDATMISRAK